MNSVTWSSLVLLTIGFASIGYGAPVIIDTRPRWTGDARATTASFGDGFQTMGQTLTVSDHDTILDSFSLFFDDRTVHPYFGPVDFAGYVMQWDGAKAIGPILYESGMRTSSNNGGLDGMEMFTFEIGGLRLVAQQQYVIFLSSSRYLDGERREADVPFICFSLRVCVLDGPLLKDDAYSGGEFVYSFNGSDLSLLAHDPWHNFDTDDAMFVATFSSPIPEPNSLLLLIAGIGLVQVFRLKQVKKAISRQGQIA